MRESTLDDATIQRLLGGLAGLPPAEPAVLGREPVHVLYGGAHLFSRDAPRKLAELARRAFEEHAPDAETLGDALELSPTLRADVHARIARKLATEPIEDLRIDFEDGYGVRPDDEEDAAATHAARELALSEERPPFVGIRIKALDHPRGSAPRAIRTLDRFLTALAQNGGPPCSSPARFVVTLPKVTQVAHVETLHAVLEALESELGLERVSIELMVEHVSALFDAEGRLHLPRLVAASRGRCVAAHLGTYDYTASCHVTATQQLPEHPSADFARQIMQVSLAATTVRLSDGATTRLPIAPHRGKDLTYAERVRNRTVIHRAWRQHHDDVRRALRLGFYQGWDLHPAQLISRYAAVFAFFREALVASTVRLRSFLDAAAQASRVGDVFDDAATGQGLLNFFLRGLACGAIDVHEVEAVGVSVDELQSRSFAAIVHGRAQGRVQGRASA